ncbi:type 1 fimbrial protein [Photorhabdus temperata]|uniref:P pilus assembly protein, pilin FimA n=1 Tax=Photorhabdus temperata subsp. temperata Meg1 TaxID=1393735 RepID=A0A081RRY5_PHOTE|nr:fimbrial protein [Photorhabdus temperata]KER01438.1 P pilus assembly protein, pilin FimA [Photorhabdus temperata subsp. temperata Meg1]MCT8346248.1 type 1 fimbrial protein [Photorhabdus temperata]
MNKLALSTAAALIFTGSAVAADNSAGGTLHFSGAVTDATCTINGGASANLTIVLAPISVTQAGQKEGLIDFGKKAFSLEFSNCQSNAAGFDPATSMLKIHFSSAHAIANDGKYLMNQELNASGKPKNVGIAIVKYAEENTPIMLNKALDTGIKGSTPAPEVVDFYAKYYKVGTADAEPGKVITTVTYHVAYL